MTSTFDRALDWLLAPSVEGGLADRPRHEDPGGRTNLGITQGTLDAYRRANPHDVMPSAVDHLTHAHAARIYRRMYWDPCRCDDLPPALALVTFDAAVMSGVWDGRVTPGRPDDATEFLQQAVGAKVDGRVGPKTIAAARAADQYQAVATIIYLRLRYMSQLPHFQSNPGWLRRMAELAVLATRWAQAEERVQWSAPTI